MPPAVWYCPICHAQYDAPETVNCERDGARVRPIAELGSEWIGRVVADKYRVVRFLDAGGMAEVYEIERLAGGKRAAMKLLHSALATNTDALVRFMQEAKLVSLIAHPNVVAIEDFGTLPGGDVQYMVMELLEGRSLTSELEAGRLPVAAALRYAMQACEGLAAAHERSVIHCDIKPSNLFLHRVPSEPEPVLKILDLGVGRLFAATASGASAGEIAGTPDYMSPEQVLGKHLGPATDIYAMGVVLYEMLLGRPPFVDDSYIRVLSMHVHEEPVWRSDLAQAREVPNEAAPIVLRALSKSPEARQPSMLDLQRDLASLAGLLRARDSQRGMPGSERGPVTAKRPAAATLRSPQPSSKRLAHDTTSPAGAPSRIRRVPLEAATGSDDEVVEVRPGVFWVGRRTRSALECNSYLLVFKNGTTEVSVLTDPGPPRDFAVISAKVASVIGSTRRLDYLHINHQDPDVAFNAGPLQQSSPRAHVLCSEDTFRLVQFYGLDPRRFIPTESFGKGRMRLPTGHELAFVPTPFCHFRGATMLYDPASRVLFSGDLFGGAHAAELVATERAWRGVEAFHQIYMPTGEALRRAAERVRRLDPRPELIAPQHGSIVTGELVPMWVERIANLTVGFDMPDSEAQDERYVSAANDLVREYADVAGEERARELVDGYAGDASFTRLFVLGGPGKIAGFKVAPPMALDALVAGALASLPAERRGDLQRSIRSIFKQ